MYQSVIFDADGVLLRHPPNDMDAYADMVAETFRAFDECPSDSDIEEFFGASKTVGKMRQVCECHDIDLETFWAERERRSSELQQQMMENGERDLYEDCTVLSTLAQTHDLGLVSTNQQETIGFMIDHFDLDGCFETVYGREPTIEGFQRVKPNTYYIEQALEDLGTRSAVYVGDSTSDVVAAHRAGLDSVFIWRDHRTNYKLAENPTYEIDQLTELAEKFPC